MKIHRLPRPSDRITEIRARRTGKLLAKFNLSTRILEIRRRDGRLYRIKLDKTLDTPSKVVYTEEVKQ